LAEKLAGSKALYIPWITGFVRPLSQVATADGFAWQASPGRRGLLFLERPKVADQLKRRLRLTDATMIVMGSMIGSGIFLTSAASMRLLPAPGWLLAAWALAGVLTITGALCCAELSAMLPRAGGQYVFLREAYGQFWGFLFGWALFLVIQTGTIAAVAVAFANFLGVLMPGISADEYIIPPIIAGRYAFSLSYQQAIAVLVILVLTFANTRGLTLGKWIQNVFTVAKTAALVGLIVCCFLAWNSQAAAFTADWWRPSANAESAFTMGGMTAALAISMLLGRAMVGPMFAQSAWNNVTFTGGEVETPGRTIPRALFTGCGAIVLLYLLTNIGYLLVLPLAKIAHAPHDRVAVEAMRAAVGASGTYLMAAAIVISTFGCNNGLILAGARVYYAMARDDLFFKSSARTNKRDVPAAALWAQGIWASLLTLPRTVSAPAGGQIALGNVYEQLLQYVISVDLVFYALMAMAVIVLRYRQPMLERPYRTLGYPLVPLAYVAIAIALIIDLAWTTPWTCGMGYLIVLTGLPAFAWWRFARRVEQPTTP
jgi:basic amino acid/polyamine antiporter, APA family